MQVLCLLVHLTSWCTRSNALPVRSQNLCQRIERSGYYLHADLLATVRTLLLMFDDGLIITAIDVQSDNSIQRNAYAQELEHFV